MNFINKINTFFTDIIESYKQMERNKINNEIDKTNECIRRSKEMIIQAKDQWDLQMKLSDVKLT